MTYSSQTINYDYGDPNMSSVKSPCVLICSIDMKTGYCFGCGRTRDEIAGWMNYTDQERIGIMETLDARLETVEHKPRRETKRQRIRRERQAAS